MSRVTREMLDYKASIINNKLSTNVQVNKRNGYYAIDVILNEKTYASRNIDCGLSAREANAILKGMMAVVCGECQTA